MKILITGGYGLIGHNVVQRLMRLGHSTNIIDNKTNYGVIPQGELDYLLEERSRKINAHPFFKAGIEEPSTVDYIFSVIEPETVIHLASMPRQKIVGINPSHSADVMIKGLINLLESAVAHKVKRFVYISSSMVYGDFQDDTAEDAVCKPLGQYGIMKLAGEMLVKDYAAKYGMEYVIIRPSAVYGPLDVSDRVIAKFMISAMHNRPLKVNGTGEKLDFTYVDDAADGIVSAALTPTAANDTYNITKSCSVTLYQAAQLVVDIVGQGEIIVANRDLDFPSRGALNIDRAKQKLNFNPKVDVEQGCRAYYEWLQHSIYQYR